MSTRLREEAKHDDAESERSELRTHRAKDEAPSAAQESSSGDMYETDPYTMHTRSLADKYDTIFERNKEVHVSLPGRTPGATLGAIHAVGEIAPRLLQNYDRPIVGEIRGEPSTRHNIETAYYSNGRATFPQYIETRASGALPRLECDVQEQQTGRMHTPGIHTSLYTEGYGNQRQIDRTRASGVFPKFVSYYRQHHNALPPNSTTFGSPAVSVAINGQDGQQSGVSSIPQNNHEQSTLTRNMAIERTRHCADLDVHLRPVDYVTSAADSAAESIRASLEAEERARIRGLEEASKARIAAFRHSVFDDNKKTERSISRVNARAKDRQDIWNQEYNAVLNKIGEEEGRLRMTRRSQENARAQDVEHLKKDLAATENRLAAVRGEARRFEAERDAIQKEPHITVDLHDINTAAAQESARYDDRLRLLADAERNLQTSYTREQEDIGRQFALQQQQHADQQQWLKNTRERLISETNELMNDLDRQMHEKSGWSARQHDEYTSIRSRLESDKNRLEAELREAMGRQRDHQRAREEERNSLEVQLMNLNRERQGMLDTYAHDRAAQQAEAQTRAREQVKNAERDYIKVQQEVTETTRRAVEARKAAVLGSAQLGLCVESQYIERVPGTVMHGRAHEAVGVEQHSHNVRLITPQTTVTTEHIHLAPHSHAYNQQYHQQHQHTIPVAPAAPKPSLWGRIFGNRTEAATMTEAMKNWHMTHRFGHTNFEDNETNSDASLTDESDLGEEEEDLTDSE